MPHPAFQKYTFLQSISLSGNFRVPENQYLVKAKLNKLIIKAFRANASDKHGFAPEHVWHYVAWGHLIRYNASV